MRGGRRFSDTPAVEQTQIQIRMDPKLKERLTAEAFRRTLSVNFLVERAIEDALKVWEKQKLS